MSKISSAFPESRVGGDRPVSRARGRRFSPLILLLALAALITVVWQVLSGGGNSTDPTIAGRPLSNPQTHLHMLALSAPQTLYLGTHFGLFTQPARVSYSDDGGTTWKILTA
jgi:hypothetical protein